MTGARIVIAAGTTVFWVIIGVILVGMATAASSLGLTVSGPFLNLASLFNAWLLFGAIVGVADVLIFWDMVSGW
ncbi:hypothetical protein EXE49_16350 [Halorubrum sp. ASP121]|uniref:hypothetical protein n=1 Tax=Halorubrum sp. ASP121 TaxID=1855858 RepID=UPI0010F7998F|nr:hypothetical protein [Halorubrum sp. ASP121]TKX48309.1 hypothetical protein EXE49_16350 [Halorubrum sp. ASP121]